MAKIKKKAAKTKTAKQKLWDNRKEYHENLPDAKRNPKHKEDFENALSKLFPPIKPKGVNKTKPRKRKSKLS